MRFAEKATAAGVSATVTVWPVVPHVWQLAQTFLPEARRSVSEAAAFLKSHANPPEAVRSANPPEAVR